MSLWLKDIAHLRLSRRLNPLDYFLQQPASVQPQASQHFLSAQQAPLQSVLPHLQCWQQGHFAAGAGLTAFAIRISQ